MPVLVSTSLNDAEAEFAGAIETLDVQSNSILVLRAESGSQYDVELAARFAQSLRKVLYARNLDDVTILVTAGDTSLEVLDEQAMAAAGWVRQSR